MTTSKPGPKTLNGKKQSAKNSTVHGLRSDNLATPQQQENYDQFLVELIDFYKPVGPLEKLQLERIAICRAKLKALYDMERDKYASLHMRYESDTAKHINHFSYLSALTRGMLRELITFNHLLLPNGLDADLLTSIVNEINSFVDDVTSDDDLREYLPMLSSYLDQVDSNTSDLHVKLLAVGRQLEQVINRGESYSEYGALLLAKIKGPAKKEKEQTPEQIAHAKELDDYIKKSQERIRAQYGAKVKQKVVEFPDHRKVSEALDVYKVILKAYQDAYAYKDSVIEIINQGKKSLSLPIEDADLLMRYQTSWERRLSTLIGEFVQLQKMRVADETAKLMLEKSLKK